MINNNKKGFTLIELIVASVIASIGMLGIAMILINADSNLRESGRIKVLQEDMHLASYMLKSVIEEANFFEIEEIIEDSEPLKGKALYIEYNQDGDIVWSKEFYSDNGNLILEDVVPEPGFISIIENLEEVFFITQTAPDNTIRNNSIGVYLRVSDGVRTFENNFIVRMRNYGL